MVILKLIYTTMWIMYKGADKVSKQVHDNHLLSWPCLKGRK